MASVHKRTWTDKDGKAHVTYFVRWKESDGKQPSKGGFELKKDADAFRRKVEREVEAGVHVASSKKRTVREVCAEFNEHNEDRKNDGRIGKSRHNILAITVKMSINPHLGKKDFASLTVQDIEAFYRWMVRERDLSPQTARERVYILKQIEDFARKRGYVKAPVVADALRELRGVVKKPIRTFTAQEVLHLLETAKKRKHRGQDRSHALFNCYVNIAAFCGLRHGEIAALTLGNVDLGARLLKVRHNLTAWDELKGPKTRAGIRDVPLPAHVAELLREWINQWYRPDPRDLLFRTKNGTAISRAQFHNNFWRRLLADAGLHGGDDPFHFHALRHFASSWMIQVGMSPPEVAHILGHSHFDTTLQIYAHPVLGGDRRHEMADRMAESLLAIAPPPIAPKILLASASHGLPTG